MIKSVERVVSILNLLHGYREGLSHSEISTALGIPHSSLFSLLGDLTATEFLARKPGTRKYQLGPQSVVLAGSYLSSQEVVRIGRPYISQLMRMTHESSILFIPKGRDLMLAARENGLHSMVVSLQIGDVTPVHVLAAGRAMMANWPDETLDEYLQQTKLEPYTRYTLTDPEQLKAELEMARRIGHVVESDQFREGITAVGMAVFDRQGQGVAGINVAVPNHRLDKAKMQKIVDSLHHVTSEFSYQLGYATEVNPSIRLRG